jgi:flagellar biosynthesis protein FlhA
MSAAAATLPAPSGLFGRLRDGQTAIALVVIGVLLVMVVPLPTFAMDLLLAANIAISLAVLLTAFYAQRPLEFAIFPGLLLVTTLFRLSLNVASTRLILGQGEAGALITAFGNFVVAGNYVVGAIIFIVLVIINFVVITKGSGRIAEVGARFTLDAMPGKQMAIDADLNAGIIDETEARQRRSDVSREADFYGSMDGASKFVRGDAMAGLIITAINIVGGLVIGMTQFGLSAADSAEKFMLLSIGDGLVSQIPALLISTAAGIIVSRASSDEGGTLSDEVGGQLFKRSQPILITGAFLVLIGLLPGLPAIPFWLMGGVLLFVGRGIAQKQDGEDAAAAREKAQADAPEPPEEQQPADLLLVDPLELEIDYALISLVDPNQNGDLLERVKMLRQQLALELGLVIPPIRIRDNAGLNANQYIIKLRGNPIGEGEVLPGYHLALLLDPDAEAPPGIHVQDPTFGLPAVWVAERNLADAERLGLTVIESPAVITTHLLEVLRKNAHRLLDRQETKKLTEKVKETNEALIDELIPNVLPLGSIQKVLKKLLEERIPIRDLVTILETLADYAPHAKHIDVLTEYVRNALAPTITRQFASPADGKIHAFVLDAHLEQMLLQKAEKGEFNPNTLGLPPEQVQRFGEAAERLSKSLVGQGHPAVLLTSPVLRATLSGHLTPALSDLSVLSYNDLLLDADVDLMGTLNI